MSNINALLLEVFDSINESIKSDYYANSYFNSVADTDGYRTPSERLQKIKKSISNGSSMYDAYKSSIDNHTKNLEDSAKYGRRFIGNSSNYTNPFNITDAIKSQRNADSRKSNTINVDPPSSASNQLKYSMLGRRGPARLSDLKGL